jgi:predicted membrane chloride channel (bestrophin family)
MKLNITHNRKQSLALYLLAIPFTLISELGWWITPTIILASFTLFGIDAIGAQIGNYLIGLNFFILITRF